MDKNPSASPATPKKVRFRFLHVMLALLVIAGAYLRVHGANAWHYNPDETIHLHVSAAPTLTQLLTFARYEVHPPLIYILCHYWMTFSADAPFMRSLPLLFGLATILLYYAIGKALGGPFTGFNCAILATYSHGLILLSYSLRQYAIFLFFLSAAFYFFILWRRNRAPRLLAGYAACGLLACMTHFSGLLTFACIFLLGTMTLLKRRDMKYLAAWAGVNLFVAGVTCYVYQLWQPILIPLKPFFDTEHFRASFSAAARLTAALSYPISVSDYFFPALLGMPAVLLLLFATLLAFLMRGGAVSGMRFYLALACLAFALGMLLLFTGIYPNQGRHSTWIVPLILPVAAFAFTESSRFLAQRLKQPAFSLIPMAALFVAGCITYNAQARFADSREYLLTVTEWQRLDATLTTLGAHDVILTERDDANLFANLYGLLGDIPFTHSSDVAFAPYRNTRILFNPYYPRSYSPDALFRTLRGADLRDVDRIVFFRTRWSRAPIVDAMSCSGVPRQVLTFPPATLSPETIENSPAALLIVSKRAMMYMAARYATTGKTCP